MISQDSYPESALDSGSFSYALLYASMIGGYPKIGFESSSFIGLLGLLAKLYGFMKEVRYR